MFVAIVSGVFCWFLWFFCCFLLGLGWLFGCFWQIHGLWLWLIGSKKKKPSSGDPLGVGLQVSELTKTFFGGYLVFLIHSEFICELVFCVLW